MLVPMVYLQRHVMVQELQSTSSTTYIHICMYVSTLTVMLLTYVHTYEFANMKDFTI